MKHHPNESAPSAPELPANWQRDLLQQRATLETESADTTDVYCVDIRGCTLLLTLLAAPPVGLKRGQQAALTVHVESGIIRVGGAVADAQRLEVNGIAQTVLSFTASPETLERINRRTSFRVSVTIKGEMAVFEPGELDQLSGGESSVLSAQGCLEQLTRLVATRKRPCIIHDLSTGGARAVTEPPAAAAGQQVLLDILLTRGQRLRNLPCRVVQGLSRGGVGDFCAVTRLRFDPLPGKVEFQLSHFINQVQLEHLRRGVRDRR